MSRHPEYRPRRTRRTAALRRLVRETRLDPANFVLPLFVRSGEQLRTPVGSMPGVAQTSVDELLRDAERAHAAGVGGVILFGLPDAKDAEGSAAWDAEGPVQRAVRALKRELPALVVMTDVCMCEYTSHGHCGVLRRDGHRGQRRDARAARARGALARGGRRRRRSRRAT
jgi:porphobilinogen synthase